MRLSEFWTAVSDEFGEPYGRVLVNDQVLGPVGGVTAAQALSRGVPAKQVWAALCDAMDVPMDRRYGVGQREPKK
ncbi:DUF3046 domain-containing protein [Salinibacterium sp. NG253]|uniref:DUF3046 domain-containing protein n=1 Tax=Salinibacterium sp. NG253 TaxID=2792039 RepID=UPI0018CF3621|nr:DUF3046 domain-containing protein [Salinibacterium sp. NG253]MBH0117928.1 DUF3046 domain-containing protein [Salinibacterium sp. NG253]